MPRTVSGCPARSVGSPGPRNGSNPSSPRDGPQDASACDGGPDGGLPLARIKLAPGEHIGVLGTTGAGKTYFIQHEVLPAFPHVVVVDTEDGYDFDTVHWPVLDANPKDALRQIRHGLERFPRFNWAWRPDPPFRRSLEELAAGLLYVGPGLCLYIDEVTDFTDAMSIGERHRALIRKARKRSITEIYSSQRAPGVNRWLLANSAYKVFFFITPDDRMRIHDVFPTMDPWLARLRFKAWDYIVLYPNGEVAHIRPNPKGKKGKKEVLDHARVKEEPTKSE